MALAPKTTRDASGALFSVNFEDNGNPSGPLTPASFVVGPALEALLDILARLNDSLPTGAALGAVTDAPAETAVGSFGLIALMKGVLAHLLGGTTQVEFATPQEMTGQFSVDEMPVTSTTTRQYNPANVVQAAGSPACEWRGRCNPAAHQ